MLAWKSMDCNPLYSVRNFHHNSEDFFVKLINLFSNILDQASRMMHPYFCIHQLISQLELNKVKKRVDDAIAEQVLVRFDQMLE